MEIKEGYVYHIKDDYFKIANDKNLMQNHEGKSSRPNYFCIKNDNDELLWFVPMSSKIEKYNKLIDYKTKKYGKCDTIVIGNYRGKNHAFLLQNIFPITYKYIDHIDTVNNKAIPVAKETRKIILNKIKRIFKLKEKRNKINFSRC